MATRFRDRADAGQQLASHLAGDHGLARAVVLGLPRGGVPVARPVADALGGVLDICVVRKLGVPGHTELAFGAIASGGRRVLNDGVVRAAGIGPETIERVTRAEELELRRREAAYRGQRSAPDLTGAVVVLVDDGLATGATMRAAVASVNAAHPRRLVVAVPVAAPEAIASLSGAVEVVCLTTPPDFRAVGQWYDDFSATTDDQVAAVLRAPSE